MSLKDVKDDKRRATPGANLRVSLFEALAAKAAVPDEAGRVFTQKALVEATAAPKKKPKGA